MSTRCLTVTLADDAEQTRAVMRAEARYAETGQRAEVDLQPFHAYQRWLAVQGEWRIVLQALWVSWFRHQRSAFAGTSSRS